MLRYMKISLLSLLSAAFLSDLVWGDCPVGDLNKDCKVNLLDFGLMAANWLEEDKLPLGSVIINEVMAHSHAFAADWIELYNTTGSPINISGWYLSDSDSFLKKYPIPNGTTIDVYDYIVFYENLHFGINHGNNTPFALSENGERVYLSFGEGGQWTGICDDRKFGASETGVSFGIYTTSTGIVEFVSMDPNTPGELNGYPKVGPIVINEIMYNSGTDDPDTEYIELHNIEDYNVTLQVYDPCITDYVPWQFTKGIEYIFPLGTTIPANGYLIVAKDTSQFTTRYGSMPPGVLVKGPFAGGTKLSNDGENVEISMPGDVDPCEPNIRYYIRIDNVIYSDGSHHENFPGLDPWPREADGDGSLQRINPNLYGNDVNNWYADSPTPGY
jgi:hypothetical protein